LYAAPETELSNMTEHKPAESAGYRDAETMDNKAALHLRQPYRKGRGCGKAVHPQIEIEQRTIAGLCEIIGYCPKALPGWSMWRSDGYGRRPTGHDPDLKRLEAVDRKIANVRKAIEDGLGDAAWANDNCQRSTGDGHGAASSDQCPRGHN
jgi:hypothetical protein